jgi:hypothetical protein
MGATKRIILDNEFYNTGINYGNPLKGWGNRILKKDLNYDISVK